MSDEAPELRARVTELEEALVGLRQSKRLLVRAQERALVHQKNQLGGIATLLDEFDASPEPRSTQHVLDAIRRVVDGRTDVNSVSDALLLERDQAREALEETEARLQHAEARIVELTERMGVQ